MGFEKFGIVSYTTEAKTDVFVDYLEKGKIMAVKCNRCGTKYFPPQVGCPKCVANDMAWFEISKKGKLITYTVVNYGPVGFEDRAPYILAVSAFEDGLQILATLCKDIKETDIAVGMLLKVVPVKLPYNKVTYEFQRGV
jgi:uncharacterized OB-fold protein